MLKLVWKTFEEGQETETWILNQANTLAVDYLFCLGSIY